MSQRDFDADDMQQNDLPVVQADDKPAEFELAGVWNAPTCKSGNADEVLLLEYRCFCFDLGLKAGTGLRTAGFCCLLVACEFEDVTEV